MTDSINLSNISADLESASDAKKTDVSTSSGVDSSKDPNKMMHWAMSSVVWKDKLVMILIFIFVCSTMFIENILGNINNNLFVSPHVPSNGGVIVQAILFVLIYTIYQILQDYGIF